MASIDDTGATPAGEATEHPFGSDVEWTRAGVVIAHAALQRVRRLWGVLFGHPWFSGRYTGDEECYQSLRAYALNPLDGLAGGEEVKRVALDALPEMLPTSDELEVHCDETRAFYESGFQRLDAQMIRLALATGAVLRDPAVSSVFASYDDYLDHLEPVVDKEIQKAARRYGLLPPASPTRQGAGRGQQRPDRPNRAQERAARRQTQVRQLLADGLTHKEIARQLKCSERTVRGDLAKRQ